MGSQVCGLVLKPAAGGVGRPLHGSALAVAAFFLGPAGDADGVVDVFLARGGVGGHADLRAVVDERGGARGVEDGGDEFGDAEFVVGGGAVAEAVPGAGVVVVVEDEQGLVEPSRRGLHAR